MHVARALSDSIYLSHEDCEWIQPLDYEHIPFRLTNEYPLMECPRSQWSLKTKNAENENSERSTNGSLSLGNKMLQ